MPFGKKGEVRMSTATIRALKIKSNLRCYKIYPRKGTKRTVRELKTVAIRLRKSQAIDLATVLLAAAQNWDIIDITAFRKSLSKKTGDYQLTVTSKRKDDMF